MKEIAQILDLWSAVSAAGEEAVLATVVKTQGSSYRLPGARLLLTKNGQRVGAISGGCLEDDVVKKAWWLTENGPVVRRYDTTPDNEISSSGYGLGCNGIIHVLLERVKPGHAAILDLMRDVREQRLPAAVAHVLEPAAEIGQRVKLDCQGAISRHSLPAEIEAETRAALASGARLLRIGQREVFVETLAPAVRLLVFGAGDDAIPLTDLAKYQGWNVAVFDGRAHYARREKFPSADEVIVRIAGSRAPAVDPWTVAVLMSHSYSQDLEALRELASLPLRYLGILGPNKRTVQLLGDAGLDPAHLPAGLHGPMGLDIGADGPEQVALAVIAEIQASLNGREGGALRTRDGSIHAREADPAAAWSQSIVCA
jgi:xanthine/CO dehydrogenase XdhC/CoxF family maturation factor